MPLHFFPLPIVPRAFLSLSPSLPKMGYELIRRETDKPVE